MNAMVYIDLILVILAALEWGFLIYFKIRLNKLLYHRRYRELLAWMKKYYKVRMISPAFSFWTACAAYLYGDIDLFREAAQYSLHMKRTWKTQKFILLAYHVIDSFRTGNPQEGMDEYRNLPLLQPGKVRNKFARTVDGLTNLMEGIAAYHSGDSAKARALLLNAYGIFSPGIDKFVCIQYLSRIFTEAGEPEHGKELLRLAETCIAGTLYEAEYKISPEDIFTCTVHLGQDIVGNCRLCGAPICIKCIDEHHEGICRTCFQKMRKLKELTLEKRDARNYLVACTAIVAGCFILFTVKMHSLYFSFPLFFQSIHKPYPWNVLQMAGIFTLIISGLFNGIWLFIRFIRNRSRAAKVTLAVFFLITFAMIYAAGVFLLIPTYIFYIGRYIYLQKRILTNEK